MRPEYLFFLFGVPLLFLIHFFSLGNRKKVALKFANFEAISRIQGVDFFSKNVVILFLSLIIMLCMIFAISGLTLHTMKEASSFSFILAIDASQSMEADDLDPNRLEASKQTAINFVNSVPYGTRIGIISFSGSSYIERDITQEKDQLEKAIQEIDLTLFGGTDLYEAVITSSNLLKNEDAKAIILLSDGQINIGTLDESIEYANDQDVIVHSIAVGTKEGGITAYSRSTLDEESLKSVAYSTGGEYFVAENVEALQNSFEDILELTDKKVSIDLAIYLIVFAIVLFVISFFLRNTRYLNLP